MRADNWITVIIPALNEEGAIGGVLRSLPEWVDEVIVVDNGSTDKTAENAKAVGANVVHESQRGYGAACLRGIANARRDSLLVFMDADASDDPRDMAKLVDPVASGKADLSIGSRSMGKAEPGALTPQARFGNWLACTLMWMRWGARFTDLGPFRAIRHSTLQRLAMVDRGYGWTVEMQIKALKHGLRCVEVPVHYRKRVGRSKISGTVKGVIGAGSKILYTIGRHSFGHS
jgi:glycosyltransferase involved in cell wall biosynthesis